MEKPGVTPNCLYRDSFTLSNPINSNNPINLNNSLHIKLFSINKKGLTWFLILFIPQIRPLGVSVAILSLCDIPIWVYAQKI